MKLCFPSDDFDDAVAAICRGLDGQARALNDCSAPSRCTRRIHSAVELLAPRFDRTSRRTHRRSTVRRATDCRKISFDRPLGDGNCSAGGDLGRLLHLVGRWVVGVARVAANERKGATARRSHADHVVDAQWISREVRLGAPRPWLASAQIGFGTGGLLQRRGW